MSAKSTKVGCAVLLSILLVCYGIQTTKTRTAILPTAVLDEKVVLYGNISQVLGIDNRKLPRLTKISYSDPERGDITITWVINDNVSPSLRKVNAQNDAINILKILEKNQTRFIYVILKGTFSMQDEYGNATEIQVMSLGFNKSKLDKINWEDFQSSNIYDLADVADIANEWK